MTLSQSEAPHSPETHDGKLRDEARALDAKLVASGRSGRRDAAAQEELSFSVSAAEEVMIASKR